MGSCRSIENRRTHGLGHSVSGFPGGSQHRGQAITPWSTLNRLSQNSTISARQEKSLARMAKKWPLDAFSSQKRSAFR